MKITQYHDKDDKQKIDFLNQFPKSYISDEWFYLIVSQLGDKNDNIRFWSMDVIVKKFPHHISNNFDLLAPIFLKLLVDSSHTVSHRAIWAISIGGEQFLQHILKAGETANEKMKMMVIIAISRNWYAFENVDLVLGFLIKNLNNTSSKIRYSTLNSLFELIEDKVLNNKLDEEKLNRIRLNAKTALKEFLNRETDKDWKDRYSNVFKIKYN